MDWDNERICPTEYVIELIYSSLTIYDRLLSSFTIQYASEVNTFLKKKLKMSLNTWQLIDPLEFLKKYMKVFA